MKWELLLAGPARKALDRMPAADRRRVLAALDAVVLFGHIRWCVLDEADERLSSS